MVFLGCHAKGIAHFILGGCDGNRFRLWESDITPFLLLSDCLDGVFLLRTLYPEKTKRLWKNWLAGVSIILGCLLCNHTLESLIIRPFHSHPEQQIMLFDVAAVSMRTHINYLPAFYGKERPFGLLELSRVFDSYDVFPLMFSTPKSTRCVLHGALISWIG